MKLLPSNGETIAPFACPQIRRKATQRLPLNHVCFFSRNESLQVGFGSFFPQKKSWGETSWGFIDPLFFFGGGGCFAVVKMMHAQIKAFGELVKTKPIRRSFSRFRSAHRRLRGCKKLPASCIRLTPLKFNSEDPKGKARFNQDFFQGQVVKLQAC